MEPAIFLVLVGIYFIPSFVAYFKEPQKKNATAIFILNLFLGWTIIGWVVALCWALCEDK